MSMSLSGDARAARAHGARLWRLWDAPVRLMHWLLVICIAVCWWTGTHDELQYHLYSGYAILWLVLMRLYWGVVGSSTARFVNFVRGPRAVVTYARGLHKRNSTPTHGHNPLGAISVLLLLGLVLAVVVFGLFSVDVDGLYSGPLSSYVSFSTGRHLAHLHYKMFVDLFVVICVHVLAVIFYYFYKRHNLLFPMITGKRRGEETLEGELLLAPVWRLVAGAILVSAIVWLISTGFYL